MITFGIPCKFDGSNDLVIQAVEQILTLHNSKDVRVVVVDSDSTDKGYMGRVEALGAIVEDVANVHYETGAWWHVYKNYQSDYYCFLHDSLILKDSIYDCLEHPITVVAYSESWDWILPDEFEWGLNQLKQIGFPYHQQKFASIFGSMFICPSWVMDILEEQEFDLVMPTCKGESRAMERLWGIMVDEIGLQWSVRENALYGPIYDILQVRNDRLDKVILRRD